MQLEILQYPHPALRHTSKPVRQVDADLRGIVRRMFELMYEAKGIGLAANQVGLPLRLFVVNLSSDPECTEEEMAFINPVLSRHKGSAEADEGCLSLPGLYHPVVRPESVTVNAFNLAGEEVNLSIEDLFARVVQHEHDHIAGTLFIDRLSETGRLAVADALAEFESTFAGQRQRNEIPSDAEIESQLAELEQRWA